MVAGGSGRKGADRGLTGARPWSLKCDGCEDVDYDIDCCWTVEHLMGSLRQSNGITLVVTALE